jgi:opacity protein-like surface antigen
MHDPLRRAVTRPMASLSLVAIAAMVAIVMVACQAAASPPRVITLRTLNDSGVTGTVSFGDLGGRTGVEIAVNPGGNPDMPAHIHPGTCDNLTPQPKYPLENVKNGASKTVVPASIDELFAGNLAVNVHKSNDDLKTYTACVEIK